jgi:hypothetical protein
MIQAFTNSGRSRLYEEIRQYAPAVRQAAALATANARQARDLKAARDRGISVPPALEAQIRDQGRAIAAEISKLDQIGAVIRDSVRRGVADGRIDPRQLPPELWGAGGEMRGLGAGVLIPIGIAVVIVAGLSMSAVGIVLALQIPNIIDALAAQQDQSTRTAAAVAQYKAAVAAEIQQAAAQGRAPTLPPAPANTPREPSWIDRISDGIGQGAAAAGSGIGSAIVISAIAVGAYFVVTRMKRSR